ncbi:hypothetical protein GCM10022254_09010 [Actinomadura meridiana]|uniref:Uncharacterized protein n=1 Tax=Actinomadura meridiana TaxID=559626 RepID=A0ABP8BUB7_9ACTN
MHIHPQPAPLALSATPMRAASTIASAAMALLGTGGLAVSVISGGLLADLRSAYLAGLAALILAGLAVLVYGGIRALRGIVADHVEHRAQLCAADARTARVCDHLTRLEQIIDQKVDGGLQDRFDQLESIVINDHERSAAQLTQVAEALADLRTTMAAFIEELHRREQDELERRRNRRGC